jgi:hypothetical protein
MDFIFHSVFDDHGRRKYFSIYKIDDTHFRAECHHFNRERLCEGDFELVKDGDDWKPSSENFEEEAKFIGEEIDRMVPSERSVENI